MGQTLTHGVYLPDEGERNCYAGLAANWQILDTSVGTIAEHTTQIAGKASASHSHGNITNDGKVGTTANKPLITGTGGAIQAGSFGTSANTFCEGNDSRLSDARTPVAHTHTKSDITNLFNSVNIWTGSQQFNVSVKFSGQTGINWARGGTTGTLPSSVLYYGFQNALDSNDNTFDRIRSYVGTAGTNFQEHVKYAWNDLTKYVTINFWINADGSDSEYKLSVKRVIPGSSNETDLGTSTNKWKTLNGVNPGALSLPDISKQLGVDTTNWDVAGGTNVYTPPANGWLHIRVMGATELTVRWNDWRFGDRRVSATATDLGVTIPVVAGVTVSVVTVASSFNGKCQFFPCLGNV